jgi:DEAD/DEAH box helicase domain-containing protein
VPHNKNRSDLNQKKGSVNEYINALKSSERFGPQVVHHEELSGSAAMFAENLEKWPGPLEFALQEMGIPKLYRHQVEATDAIRRGENVIVATPTASGKSLIYNLPVFERIIGDQESRALYLFPLKALAQDQHKSILNLSSLLPDELQPTVAIYDGDTSAYKRKKLRDKPPNILITNPDMLHLSMLGYHSTWSGFFSGLSHIILDEVHTYRGIFGSHMAWVLRRLQRICSHYDNEPQFILSSATVANPDELARDLLGKRATVVSGSGAPRAKRHFVFVNPYDTAATAAIKLLPGRLSA